MGIIKKILLIILAICILAVGYFVYMIIGELNTDSQSRSFYSSLAASARLTDSEKGKTDAKDDENEDLTAQARGESEWTPYVDFEELSLKFPGLVGWIKLDGSEIDYPVMQHTDNDYFIERLPDGKPHRNGSIFLDYRNESEFSDKNMLIYGHMTRNQDMFGELKRYRNQDFFDANSVIWLHTPEKDYMIVLFSAHLAHSRRDHPPLSFEDTEFMDYIEKIKKASLVVSDVIVNEDDRIVSFCTCAYDFNEARLIITGVLAEK